jgi:O-antigen/teichoic acid export membrane protein
VTEPAPSSHSHDGMEKSVNRGLAWIGAASSLVGVLDIVATVLFLNFWITPKDFGIATMAIWILPLLDVATDLSTAVIQRENYNQRQLSAVFWFNMLIGGVVFAIIVVGAPPLAEHFYKHPIIGSMLIAYGTKLIWQNAYLMPMALMKRELRFKELSVIRIIANIAEFGVKVGFAAGGWGIWAFVLGPIARGIVTAVGVQICHPWIPQFNFSFRDAKDHVVFGLRTSGSQLLFHTYTNLDYPVVGYFFGETALGLYKTAYEIVLEPVRIISAVVVDIAFPAFAKLRHKPQRLAQQLITFTRLNLITVMGYSAVVFVIADELLGLAFPKYVDAADAVRILCIVAVVRAISYVLPPLLDGMGLPHRTFTYSLVASVLLPLLFLVGAIVLGDQLGMLSVAVAWAVGYPLAFLVLLWLALQSIEWKLAAYLKSIAGVSLCMVGAALVGMVVHWAFGGFPQVVRLLVSTGAIVAAIGLLLAYTQGISVRSMMRSMKDEPPVDTPPSGLPTVQDRRT